MGRGGVGGRRDARRDRRGREKNPTRRGAREAGGGRGRRTLSTALSSSVFIFSYLTVSSGDWSTSVISTPYSSAASLGFFLPESGAFCWSPLRFFPSFLGFVTAGDSGSTGGPSDDDEGDRGDGAKSSSESSSITGLRFLSTGMASVGVRSRRSV